MKSALDLHLHYFMLSIRFLSGIRHTIEGKCVVKAVSHKTMETKSSLLFSSETLPSDSRFWFTLKYRQINSQRIWSVARGKSQVCLSDPRENDFCSPFKQLKIPQATTSVFWLSWSELLSPFQAVSKVQRPLKTINFCSKASIALWKQC